MAEPHLALVTLPHGPQQEGDAARAPASGSLIGRYQVVDPLGAGAMGQVVLAFDPVLQRRVALKLLRSGSGDGAEARSRVRAEARAMARVAHRNVVAVHDVIEVEGDLLIAMEYVEGGTLREWLAAAPRSTGEVLGVLARCGRGLLAAHAAGLVHRDFKPDNVLLRKDGSVAVADFGEARHLDDVAARAPGAHASVTGTPGYMAPEVIDGGAADARSDAFSFAVTAWEALHGARPFDGGTLQALRAAIVGQELQAPREPRALPRGLRRALLRALRAAPEERGTLKALVEALARRPLRTRALGAAAVVALAAAALVAGRAARERRACAASAAAAAQVWSAEERARVEAAFRAGGAPAAEQALQFFTGRLDAWARQWSAAERESCEAARVRGEQPQEVRALGEGCLQENLASVRVVLDLTTAPEAARVLPVWDPSTALARCSDLAGLRAQAPGDGRITAALVRLRVERFRAGILLQTGSPDAAAALGRLEQDARALGYRPFLAEVLLLRGWFWRHDNRPKEERAVWEEAAMVGSLSGRNDLAGEALLALLEQVFVEGGDLADALRYGELARLALERAGREPASEARRRHLLGVTLVAAGRAGEGAPLVEQAIDLYRSVGVWDGPADALCDLAAARERSPQPDLVASAYARCLAAAEPIFGAEKLARLHAAAARWN